MYIFVTAVNFLDVYKRQEHEHEHSHEHDHSHEHEHSHEHDHSHEHEHSHDHTHTPVSYTHLPWAIRMNLALPHEQVKEAMERLKKYVFCS